MHFRKMYKNKFSIILGIIQLNFLALFFVYSDYDNFDGHGARNSNENVDHYFPIFFNIHAMIFFGIAFLLTFIRKYGYTGLSMNMLLAAISIQVSVLMQNVWRTGSGKIKINFTSLLLGEFAAASVLISLGGIFGKVSTLQMVFFAIFETVCYVSNEHLCFEFLKVSDTGESVCLHLFAAAFGLSVAFVLDWGKKVRDNPNETTSYNSNIFCMLGTIFLYVMWPAFNSALSSGEIQQRSAINTFLALLASCITAFVTSSCVDKEQKFNMTHIQNATLAGGVAIGTVTDLLITPAGALSVGAIGGIISVLGYVYVTPFLAKYFKIYDPCGINSLHAIPGIFSGIVGAIVASTATENLYGSILYDIYPAMKPVSVFNSSNVDHAQNFNASVFANAERTSLSQACYQLLYVIVNIGSAVLCGLATGILLRQPFFEPLEDEEMYTDEVYWNIPKSKPIDRNECTKCSRPTTVF